MSALGRATLTVVAVLWAAHLCPALAQAIDRPSPPPDRGPLPAFSLRDHTGMPLTRAGLAGLVWAADFIFTRCAGQCPLMSAQMARLQERWRDEADVRLVSFTVDPEHDTPEVLAGYARHYRAQPGRWLIATGERSALWALALPIFTLKSPPENGTPACVSCQRASPTPAFSFS